MTEPPISSPRDEDAALRERVAALERELTEQAARANAAVAKAQDRSYWLDPWHLDLHPHRRRPGAGRLRFGLRVLRAVYRLAYRARIELRETRERLRSERD
jgi:hypothetical protein